MRFPFSPVAMGVWAMELNLEATGGASDFSRQVELDSSQLNFDLESWDDGYADLERTSQPHLHADSEHYSPSVSEPAASHVGSQPSQYRGYNFQNSLRDAAFNNSTTLPDLPWESPMWKCIFDDEYDPLDEFFRNWRICLVRVCEGSWADVGRPFFWFLCVLLRVKVPLVLSGRYRCV